MPTNFMEPEVEFLGRSGEMISIANNTPEIYEKMEEYSYTAEVREEGQALHAAALTVYNQNRTEHNEALASYDIFAEARTALEIKYRRDKKKAKVVFKRQLNVLHDLAIDQDLPQAYQSQMDAFTLFYTYFQNNESQLTKMGRLKFGAEDLTEAFQMIEAVVQTRKNYLREKGEDQKTTIAKDEALEKLHIWMADFLDVAEIAFDEDPQMLEMLGIVVKR